MTGGVLLAAYPQLFVADLAAASDFYERRLGFCVVFMYGSPPFYGQMMRDGVRLNFRHVDTPVIDAPRREREALLSAYIPVHDVAALFAEFEAAGVGFQERLKKKPWGSHEFVLRDLDGNLLCFGEG